MKFLIPFLLATTASAEPLTIAAGKPTGGYDKAAQSLSQRLSQRSVPSTVQNFNGSDEITLSICAKNTDIGFTQIDAIYARAKEGCILRPLALYGHEYATIWFPPDSSNNELEDLDDSNTILVDTVGSGTDLFWHTIRQIELDPKIGNGSEWASALTLNEELSLAPTLADIDQLDAVIIVRKPNSPDLRFLEENGWERGWLYDKDINDVEFNGESLYAATDNSSAYEIRSYLVAGPTFDNALTRTVQGAMK